jgi:4,5-DOPA dioxygenase extradiol
MTGHIVAADFDALRDYRQRAPFAERNHPSEEHLMPLFVALGLGSDRLSVKLLHGSADHGVMRMDAYSFE